MGGLLTTQLAGLLAVATIVYGGEGAEIPGSECHFSMRDGACREHRRRLDNKTGCQTDWWRSGALLNIKIAESLCVARILYVC